MLSFLLFGLFFTQPSFAQEGGGLMDIDIGDIELEGDTKGGDQTLSYEGAVDQNADNYKPGTWVYITHTKGDVSVRCTDSQGLTARINYSIQGANRTSMERVGAGIGLSSYASTSSAKVTTRVPGLSSGVTAISAPLVVTLPKLANVSVTGGNGWVQVVGCEGQVKVNAKGGGIFAGGKYSMFNLTTNSGNVELELDPTSEITASSLASSTAGDVIVKLPSTQKGTLAATGETVSVEHFVSGGVNSATQITGSLSDSAGPKLTFTAKAGKVEIKSP